MNLWLTLIKSYIPHERDYFHLLTNRNLSVSLPVNLEVSECRVAEGPDCGEVASTQLLLPCECGETGNHFVIGIENNSEYFFSCLVKQFRFYLPSSLLLMPQAIVPAARRPPAMANPIFALESGRLRAFG